MKVTYNWLKEFVDFDLNPEKLADLLTMLGLEVEGMESLGSGLDQVVVAVVEEKAQHPNADKLSLCNVNNGKEVLSIVCGAQNFKAGDKVALAQIGAALPGDFKIKRSKIRGVESHGMLCSEKELGLAEESEGIMILQSEFPLGVPVFDALGLKDTVYEIGLTPNRADCLSVIGIAREIAAKLGKKVRYADAEVVEEGSSIHDTASVEVEDPELCPRYTARYISGCKIGPSPSWIVNRLKAVGIRSINNVVDITNYVLMEYGHPLHAFDHNLLAEGRIVVKRSAEGERFTTLDGQERVLSQSDLTICDGKNAVALAGIMGGQNSEVSPTTANILLESAYFAPSGIRKTSKRTGLHTEASHRFERGADINIVVSALNRAASLIRELAGGRVAKGIIDVFGRHTESTVVNLRQEKVNEVLGINLTSSEITTCLENLEFRCEILQPGKLRVEVPSFRVDIEREIDLIEEVARIVGYEKIPVTMPKVCLSSEQPPLHQRLERKLRDLLSCHGLSEVINFSFISPDFQEKILLGNDDFRRSIVALMNPLNEDQSVMRTTLLPGLLETAARNISFRNLNLQLFEMGRVYLPKSGDELPDEPLYIGAFLTGQRGPEGWNQTKELLDFFDAKGIIENILYHLGISDAAYENKNLENFYHPGKASNLVINGEKIGSLGEIHPTVQEHFGLEAPGYYFELDFEKLIAARKEKIQVISPSRYPDTFRDIAMLVKDETEVSTILEAIRSNKIKELEGVELFDLYKGGNIPVGEKSIAVRVRYRSYEKTLTDDEINLMHNKVTEGLVKKTGAVIR